MQSSRRAGRGSLADYLRGGMILLGAVLMGLVTLVVGPAQVNWPAVRVVFVLLIGLAAVLTIRFMPIRLPGEPRARGNESLSDTGGNARTGIIAAATLAGGAAAPLLAGVAAFFFLLAIVAGWLLGVSAKVILRSRRR